MCTLHAAHGQNFKGSKRAHAIRQPWPPFPLSLYKPRNLYAGSPGVYLSHCKAGAEFIMPPPSSPLLFLCCTGSKHSLFSQSYLVCWARLFLLGVRTLWHQWSLWYVWEEYFKVAFSLFLFVCLLFCFLKVFSAHLFTLWVILSSVCSIMLIIKIIVTHLQWNRGHFCKCKYKAYNFINYILYKCYNLYYCLNVWDW